MTATALATHRECLRHVTPEGHPERAARLERVLGLLEARAERGELHALDVAEAPLEALRRVHTDGHLAKLEATAARAHSQLDADTHAVAASWRAAKLASGAALAATADVMQGRHTNAFVAVRPPGHHAERDTAMGFCLLNHVAVAARSAQLEHGAERVAVIDWDVHHGNGTQHIFESDPSVFYASLHEAPLYPGTGARSEVGNDKGQGTTLNLPQAAGAGDEQWARALIDDVLPSIDAFAPDLILISAGFDAHAADPLANTQLTSEVFGVFTELVCELAERRCHGRVVSLLEGGYELGALVESVEAHVDALTGR